MKRCIPHGSYLLFAKLPDFLHLAGDGYFFYNKLEQQAYQSKLNTPNITLASMVENKCLKQVPIF